MGRLVEVGTVFDFGESTIRVTLARLKRSGLAATAGRGLYTIGPKARPMQERIRSWRHRESLVRPWDASWVAVHTGPIGGRALRRTLRALHDLGFRRLEPGLQLRPNNLQRGTDGVRDQLLAPLDHDLAVFRVLDLDDQRDGAARLLWNSKEIAQGYQRMLRRLTECTDRIGDLEPLEAARQTWLTYDAALRLLLKDPLLPDELIDSTARQALNDATDTFHQTALDLWRQLLS